MAMTHPSMSEWILITGASAGIGEVFAKRFAALAHPLVLVARSAEKLKTLAQHLESTYQIKTVIIQANLTERTAPKRIFEELNRQGIQLHGLINNAGCGAGGRFVDVPTELYLNMIDLNIRSLVELTHLFLPGMVHRKKGFVINVSSTASFQPIPYSSVYAASKVFVTFFSEALWLETKNTGVRILNLCPGLTKTDFGKTAKMGDFHSDRMAEQPGQVVETALNALKKDVPTVISGWHNRLLATLERLVPHSVLLWGSLLFQNSRKRG